MGLGWDKVRNAGAAGSGFPDVDLDATAVQFTGDQLFDLVFYNNLRTRDGSVVHLGDNLTGRGGATTRRSRSTWAACTVPSTPSTRWSSYWGHSLEWIGHAYAAWWTTRRDVELARFTLTGGVPATGLVLAKLVRDGDRWRAHAIGEGIAATVPSEVGGQAAPVPLSEVSPRRPLALGGPAVSHRVDRAGLGYCSPWLRTVRPQRRTARSCGSSCS